MEWECDINNCLYMDLAYHSLCCYDSRGSNHPINMTTKLLNSYKNSVNDDFEKTDFKRACFCFIISAL